MDIVEINKLTQKKKVHEAEIRLYELLNLSKDQSLTLVLNACRKQYGLQKTVKIIHGLGVQKIGQ